MLYLLVFIQLFHSSVQGPVFNDESAPIRNAATRGDNNHVQTAMDIIIEANSKRGMTQHLLGGDVMPKTKRNAVSISLWKWNNRKIPYIIKETDFSGSALNLIKDAINTFNKEVRCIKWTPRTDETDYVRIRSGGGCVSSVGKDGGVQDLFLGSDCYYKGVILHEMTHATGFYHEQSRPDRDKYVQVNWDNILSDKREDFKKVTQYIDTLGAPYDYGSVMHYGKTTFSANGKPTLTALFDPKGTMGQRDGFSSLDVWKINALYRCTRYVPPPVPVWMAGHSTSSATTDLSNSVTASTSFKTTQPSTTPSTTKPQNICPEELTLPKGSPGQPRKFQVFTFTSALRVTWEPPCTSVEIMGYNLIYWNSGGNKLSIRLPPNKLTHYIGTILHKGQRYQITLAAISKYGTGQRTNVVSTYSACGNDVVLRGNETYDRIYSPHLSQGYYEPDVACQWTIAAPEGHRVKLFIDTVNMPGSCNEDFLKIDDRYVCTAPQDRDYILSDKEMVKIVFYSTQGSGPRPGGFHLIAMVEDNTPRNVSVKDNIPGLLVVTWQPPEGKTSFQYKFKYRVYPNVDQHVLSLDSHRTFWPIRTLPHYGRQYEIELMTVTGGKDDNPKILMVRAACGKSIKVERLGILHNPRSNGGYEPDVQCEWKLHGSSGRNLVLNITKLDLEVSSNCQNDYLEIEEIGRFCRPDQTGSVLNIGHRDATVRFVTNMDNERTGFELQYEIE